MAESKQVVLPVTGMTCANCVATIERNLKKLDGVSLAAVNLSSERATVEFDPAKLALPEIIGRVRRAGYDIAVGDAELLLPNLSDAADAARLEKALTRLDGIQEVQVNLASSKARIKYIPTLISQQDIRQAVKAAGFEASEVSGMSEDAEA